MRYRNNKTRSPGALTLVEMLIAMAIMAIVFAVVLPQFRAIQNSWASKQAAAEILQNSRVLIDHLNRNLSKAVRITAVSDSSETNGYIEFEDNDANNLRYDIAANNYVEFGDVGDLYELAGPVSQLLFTCYDGNDFDVPITDVNSIRFIKVQTTLTNPSAMGQDKTFTAAAYLRTKANFEGLVGWWKLDESGVLTAADSSGNGNDGTLTNMASNQWTTGVLDGALEFDGWDDYVSCQNDKSLQLTDALTIAGWVKADSWGSGYYVSIIARKGEGNPNNYQLAIADGQATLYLDDGDSNGFRGDTVLNTGQWYHVAGTWDGAQVRIYLNGILDNDPPDSYSWTLNTDTRDLYIGGRSGGTDLLDGTLDDVRIYDRALTAEEIQSIVAFQQDEGSDGIVSIEAEHYNTNTPQGSHQWTFDTSYGGYSGEGAMRAEPDNSTNQNTGYAANSPRLNFVVNFVKTGTHYVWVRGYGKNGNADSCHAGLDGQEISTCDRLNYFNSSYDWKNGTMDGPDATFNVSTAGIHTLNIWMREDGFVFDKIVLTNSSSYTPFGTGPTGSAQGGGGGGINP
jgi:type II secretory pathway pseudopilin PulG